MSFSPGKSFFNLSCSSFYAIFNLLLTLVIFPSSFTIIPSQSPALATYKVLFKSKATKAQLPEETLPKTVLCFMLFRRLCSTVSKESVIAFFIDY